MNIKKLREQKNALIGELEALNAACEERTDKAFSEEEQATYDAKMKELKDISQLLARADALKDATKEEIEEDPAKDPEEVKRTMEEANLALYIRTAVSDGLGTALERANMTKGANGVVIPTTIAQKVLDKLENICPIFEFATKFNYKGKVIFPVIDESQDAVTVAYADEFSTLTSHVHKFDKVELEGHLYATLVLISQSLINNSAIDIESIVVNKIAYALKKFLEHECLIGTSGKMTGVLSSANVVQTASAGVISADDLIDLKAAVIQPLQANCAWYMNQATLTTISKIKDGNGRYILNNDITTAFKDQLFGKPVYVTDALEDVKTGEKPVIYADMSGLYINMGEAFEIKPLLEKYAEQHAIGLNAWGEADSKIAEPQKIAVLEVK